MSWRKVDPPASLNGVLRPFTVSVRKGGVFLSQDLARSIQERRFDLFHVAKKVATGRMSVDALAETFRVKMHVAAKFMLEFGPALEEYERLPEAERPGALAAWLAYFEEGAK